MAVPSEACDVVCIVEVVVEGRLHFNPPATMACDVMEGSATACKEDMCGVGSYASKHYSPRLTHIFTNV